MGSHNDGSNCDMHHLAGEARKVTWEGGELQSQDGTSNSQQFTAINGKGKAAVEGSGGTGAGQGGDTE